jgi:hypothetical protein
MRGLDMQLPAERGETLAHRVEPESAAPALGLKPLARVEWQDGRRSASP